MNTWTRMAALCAVSLVIAGAAGAASDEKAEKAKSNETLENLGKAFNGESNAKVKYEAFAKKADEEGFLGVASLFRAAAKAEAIHAASLEKQIKRLKGDAKAVIVSNEVKTTKENLEAAIKGETDEATTMYPAFLKQAEAEKDAKAARVFGGNQKVEAQHAELYKQALAKIDEWKAAKKEFNVCPTCGFTTADKGFKKCPVCSEPEKKFLTVK